MKLLNEHHTFTGMQRDLNMLKHPANYLYDARNIRITSRGEDTLLSITNERGSKEVLVSNDNGTTDAIGAIGYYLGHCLLNKYLVIFSLAIKPSLNPKDKVVESKITRIDLETKQAVELYSGKNNDLNFDRAHPIETLGFYENENIQKVYWTDNYNQPRVINIVGNIKENSPNQFDFVRELELNEIVTITKEFSSSGSFAPGVIQYAFTYYNKYGQESNIFYVSPLLYTSYADRGGSPEDKIPNTFNISIRGIDEKWDYIRIYSIQRTSLNATPIVRRVIDVEAKEPSTKWEVEDNNADRDDTTYHFITCNKLPNISVDGKIYSPTVLHTYDGNYPLLGTGSTPWYGFTKKEFPNLKVQVYDKWYTWSQESKDSSVMWISSTYFSISGLNANAEYYVVETQDSSDDGIKITHDLKYTKKIVKPLCTITDNGIIGEIIDPTELLYKGGESIICNTMTHKDGTLFLGNITLKRPAISAELKDKIVEDVGIKQSTRVIYPNLISTTDYRYANQLTSYGTINGYETLVPCGGFKRGDYYRCGVQFQYKTGKWSDPIYLKDIQITNTPSEGSGDSISVPTLQGTISTDLSNELVALGYRKARAVVVFPDLNNRKVICQGVTCPTLYTKNNRNESGIYAQSSWFFRALEDTTSENSEITTIIPSSVGYQGGLKNTIRRTEIQGVYKEDDRFLLDYSIVTLHSPDIEFNEDIYNFSLNDTSINNVGTASFVNTYSDINIQTESPTIASNASGFCKHTVSTKSGKGFIAGLFYEDWIVNYQDNTFAAFKGEGSPMKWFIYPWHKNGSLNNDISRPTDKGVRSAVLKSKVISNLRYATTSYNTSDLFDSKELEHSPVIYSSDQVAIEKIGDKIYQGNIDTMLNPSSNSYYYLALDTEKIEDTNIDTSFDSTTIWHLSNSNSPLTGPGSYNNPSGLNTSYPELFYAKGQVRMKYKSTPHAVVKLPVEQPLINNGVSVKEILNNAVTTTTVFGGVSNDILRSHSWIPCGEPITIGSSDKATTSFNYDYGDTYYQRYDCLKTYPFTNEDPNQIVEIGSFMLESRINIDGRYDKNRGQMSNINMSPINFNLINPVYSQVNNFFTYRIIDDDFGTLDKYINHITWTKEKQSGSEIDTWTNITLASTLDVDGSKGEITSLKTWNNNIYCFQPNSISTILFNSRVQIPVSDGVPVEITNNYKVDGYRTLLENIGCDNKDLIKDTRTSLYFIDHTSNHLYTIGENTSDISLTHNMTSWFDNAEISKLHYDIVHSDLYIETHDECLCFSEVLGQFTSFYDYDNLNFIESYNSSVYSFWGVFPYGLTSLKEMFVGDYNKLMYEYRPWYISFISNGSDSSMQDFDKTFATVDYRMDMSSNGEIDHYRTFNTVRVNNEYQDTEEVTIDGLISSYNNGIRYNHKSPVKKKFRIWRLQIPRNTKNGFKLDRIRNPWCKVQLKWEPTEEISEENNVKSVLYDLNVQYYI